MSTAVNSEDINVVDRILAMVQALGKEGFPSCVVGAAALNYYGVPMPVEDVEICVPADKLKQATDVLAKDVRYESRGYTRPELRSLTRMYQLYALKGHADDLCFRIMPTTDHFVHFNPATDTEYSKHRAPFPSRIVFAKGLLATQRLVYLVQLIDGLNLSADWGHKNLNLSVPIDAGYIANMNKAILESLTKLKKKAVKLPEHPDLKKQWDHAVSRKTVRIDESLRSRRETQYRIIGAGDPTKSSKSMG
ncbi:hypothetical protein B0T24DRAFT_595488 [Lasiosphaeria ovina]|uniref:Nucleotidyltransferase family protein n=1 Tax=Lasiosphaeria ovina TaxID=92902 RepID=A0AAE0K8A3_9PEZI|nr:hypothetical protein B0T24DRAFT_595488 [Lasiosphaeria ovina]